MSQLEGRVLVTGGAGFIARALYARARDEAWDARFIALSREDGALRAVQERFSNVHKVLRADVDDLHLVRAAVRETRPDVVIHAAAAKYVDVSEANAWDTVRVNVIGSQNVAIAAVEGGFVKTAIAISTDKACMPVNTYGATKFVMERLWQEASRWAWGQTQFKVARYGNVIGSTGSALPRMREQAAKLEKVTVTDPDMTRFWMTAHHALDVLLAAAEAPSGTVTLPTDIRSSTLLTAVHAAVGDMGLVLMGERPGEKSDEVLLSGNESRRASYTRDGRFAYIEPPTVKPEEGVVVRELTSDAPWAGHWSAPEIAVALDEAATI